MSVSDNHFSRVYDTTARMTIPEHRTGRHSLCNACSHENTGNTRYRLTLKRTRTLELSDRRRPITTRVHENHPRPSYLSARKRGNRLPPDPKKRYDRVSPARPSRRAISRAGYTFVSRPRRVPHTPTRPGEMTRRWKKVRSRGGRSARPIARVVIRFVIGDYSPPLSFAPLCRRSPGRNPPPGPRGERWTS